MVNLDNGGYATPDDLAADPWRCTPDHPVRLLWSATFVVARAINANPYTDAPAAGDAAPLRDATCAQAASWDALGIDPSKIGVGGPTPVKSSQLLSGKVEYDTTAQATALAAVAGGELAPDAESILRAAGLLWLPTPIGDDNPTLPTWGLSGPCAEDYAWPAMSGWPYQ